LLRQVRHGLLVRVLDDRHDQPVGDRDTDADMNRLLVEDPLRGKRRVDHRKRPERPGRRAHDEGGERDVDALAGLPRRLVGLPVPDQGREIHLDDPVGVGDLPLALRQALGDRAADGREPLELIAGGRGRRGRGGGPRGAGGGRGGRGGRAGGRGRGGGGGGRGGGGGAGA